MYFGTANLSYLNTHKRKSALLFVIKVDRLNVQTYCNVDDS